MLSIAQQTHRHQLSPQALFTTINVLIIGPALQSDSIKVILNNYDQTREGTRNITDLPIYFQNHMNAHQLQTIITECLTSLKCPRPLLLTDTYSHWNLIIGWGWGGGKSHQHVRDISGTEHTLSSGAHQGRIMDHPVKHGHVSLGHLWNYERSLKNNRHISLDHLGWTSFPVL